MKNPLQTFDNNVVHIVDVFNVGTPTVSSYVITIEGTLKADVTVGEYDVKIDDGTFVGKDEKEVALTPSAGKIVVGQIGEETTNNAAQAARRRHPQNPLRRTAFPTLLNPLIAAAVRVQITPRPQ